MTFWTLLWDLLLRLPPERREEALARLLYGRGCECNRTHAGACS